MLKKPAYRFKRIGLEAGPLAQWLFSALAEAELPVVCVETRHMQAVLKAQINKTDRNDARGIAQMMRVGLYRPVHVKTLRSQKLRMLLTHPYGPAARCKPKMMIWRRLVLRFCIRPTDGAFELLAIMDIRARSISFASRPRRPDGSPDHERAGETFLHLLFSDSQMSCSDRDLCVCLAFMEHA